MRSDGALGRNPVARSLKITASTHVVVASFSAGVALNGTIAFQALGPPAQAVLVAVIFASLAACSLAISVDLFDRSHDAVSNLVSIGASRGSISSAVAGAVLAYGAGGAALGAGMGGGLGAALLKGASGGAGIMGEVALMVVVSSAAVAVGVYGAGRVAWRN